MSFNTAHANGGVLIFNGEVILLYCDGVDLHFEGPSTKEFNGSKKGRLYLTTHRMIFTNKSNSDPMQSFSFPFFSMSGIELEQPIFGANFIKGKVNAQAGGNWTGDAVFKLKFMTGGAIEYGQAMLQAAKMASRYMPPQPPPYVPNQGPYYPAQPPSYTPPAGGYSGFVPPTHVFPDAPPANSVYMTDMPPPYPGIYPPPYAYFHPPGNPPAPPGYAPANPPPPGYAPANPQLPGYGPANPPPHGYGPANPPAPGFNAYGQAPPLIQNGHASSVPSAPPHGAMSKEQEAYAAFENPYNPHQVFMPGAHPNQFSAPPPPYSEAAKKDQ